MKWRRVLVALAAAVVAASAGCRPCLTDRSVLDLARVYVPDANASIERDVSLDPESRRIRKESGDALLNALERQLGSGSADVGGGR